MLVVFGSLNVDMLFRVERLPRPGETVLCPGYALAAGGKGANQAAAAARAGAGVRMVGQLGTDGLAPVARAALVAAGVDCSGIAASRRPTGTAVIGVDAQGENQIIVASGANLDTAPDQLAAAPPGPGDTLLCQNEVPPAATFAALAQAQAAGARTLLNLAPAVVVPAPVLDRLDVLIVNEHELAVVAEGTLGGDPLAMAHRLAQQYALTCIVTLGSQGALALTAAGGWRIGTLAVEVVDTTGAGDAFVGVLAAGLEQALALPDALRRASAAAGLACSRLGAQASQPDAAAIDAALAQLAPATPL